jgi:hypothetical protein
MASAACQLRSTPTAAESSLRRATSSGSGSQIMRLKLKDISAVLQQARLQETIRILGADRPFCGIDASFVLRRAA